MAVEAILPTLTTVVATAAIDSVNPCAIGVLILLISVLLAAGQSKKKMFTYGIIYILAVMITYLIAGLGLIKFFAVIPLAVTEYISIVVGVVVIGAGLIEIKDFFWYGQGFSLMIPSRMAKKLHHYAQRRSIPGVIFLGVFVSAVELPCTGAPYLAITTLLAQYFDWTAFLLLVLYNIIFVLPLIIILLMVLAGVKLHEIKRWKHEKRKYMRLATGVVLIFLGWLLMLIANGTLNIG